VWALDRLGVVLTGSRRAVWPQVGPVLAEARTTGTRALAASVAAVARCEPRQARRRCGWLEANGAVGLLATRRAELEGLHGARVCRNQHPSPLFFWWGCARQFPSLDQRPDKRHSTPHQELSVHNDVDDHPDHRPSAWDGSWFRVTWPAHFAAIPATSPSPSRRVDAAAGRDAQGCWCEGLHQGVRDGLPEGVRPASDPAPGAMTPGHDSGGGSGATADLRGERW
jgi:hypothetical protein